MIDVLDQLEWLKFLIKPEFMKQKNLMKKLSKKYAELLHQASIATGRKESVALLHKAAKLQTKFNEKSKI